MSNEKAWDLWKIDSNTINVEKLMSKGGLVVQSLTDAANTAVGNCIIPGQQWLQPYDQISPYTRTTIYPYYSYSNWREETTASGPCYVLDLPGVPPENLRIEMKDDRWLYAYYTRVDGSGNFEQVQVIDLYEKRIDPDSAEASFKLCVLRVKFNKGNKAPGVRQIDFGT